MSSENKVKEWLVKTGYPLEMEVAAAFQKYDFSVTQANFYADPDTGESREIDVIAEMPKMIDDSLRSFNFIINIECKKSTVKPWVLFLSSNKASRGESFRFTAGNRIGQTLIRRASVRLAPKNLPLLHVEQAAYGMTQALSEGNKDTCYQALMQISKATNARVHAEDKYFKDLYSYEDDDTESTEIVLVFSVIIVDGELYVAELKKDTSTLNVSKVDRQVLFWKNPITGPHGTMVHVVSRSVIDSFISGALETYGEWYDWCQRNLDMIDRVSKREKHRMRILNSPS